MTNIIRKILSAILFISLLAINSCKYLGIEDDMDEKKAVFEQKLTHLNNEYIPVRFKILKKNDNKLKVAIKFFDYQGRVINRIEKEFKGTKLLFDYISIPYKKKVLSFPYKIYSDQVKSADVEPITKFYNVDNFPQIYYETNINAGLKAGLIIVFSKIQKVVMDTTDVFLRGATIKMPEYQTYAVKQKYKFITRSNGAIIVNKEL